MTAQAATTDAQLRIRAADLNGEGEYEPETRGYMLRPADLRAPDALTEQLQRVAEAGFNLVLCPVYDRGAPLFPCQALVEQGIYTPPDRWDALAHAHEIAAERGLAVWALAAPFTGLPRFEWFERLFHKRRSDWAMRAHPRLGRRRDRALAARHACPINRDFRRHLADVLTECVARYPIEGLVLDFTGFAMRGGPPTESPFCFCARCREQYAAQSPDHDLLLDAAEPRRHSRLRTWQVAQVHEFIFYMRHRALRSRPGLRLVCRGEPTWRDGTRLDLEPTAGQPLVNWPPLMESGTIDSLLVDHHGEAGIRLLGPRLAADYAHIGDRAPFMPVIQFERIGATASPQSVIGRYPIAGFIAQCNEPLGEIAVRRIRENWFAQPASLPQRGPVRAAIYLLERARRTHEDQPRFHDLIADFLRLLARSRHGDGIDFQFLQVIEENMYGLEQFIRRGRLGRDAIPESTLRDLGLARRLVRMASVDARAR